MQSNKSLSLLEGLGLTMWNINMFEVLNSVPVVSLGLTIWNINIDLFLD